MSKGVPNKAEGAKYTFTECVNEGMNEWRMNERSLSRTGDRSEVTKEKVCSSAEP